MRGATTGIVFDPTDRRDAGPGYRWLRVGIGTFLVAAVAFFVGSAVFVVWGGTPPSATPIASVLGHVGWFIAVAFLAIGAVALFRGIEPLATGLAGYVAVGTLALGVALGVVAIVATGAVLLSAVKNAVFAATVLLHPLFYLWAILFALELYR